MWAKATIPSSLPPNPKLLPSISHCAFTRRQRFLVYRVDPQPEYMPLWPKTIRILQQEKVLEIVFQGGERFTYPAELLRALSPAANSKGMRSTKKVVGGRRHVSILGIELVGNYACQLHFDDLHKTGIFEWAFLQDLGKHKYSKMKEYIRELRAQGLSRDPQSRLRLRQK